MARRSLSRFNLPLLLVVAATVSLLPPHYAALSQTGIVVENCYVTLIEDVEISAEAPGAIMALAASEGMEVKAGDRLGTVDDRQARSSYALAEIEVQSAEAEAGNDVRVRYATAQYEVAVAEYEAAKDANQRRPGSISRSETRRLQLQVKQANLGIEQAQVEQKMLTFKVQSARAKLQAARDEIERRQISAPLDGVVVELRRHAGEWVSPGDPVLHIIRMNRLRIEGFLNNNKHSRDQVEGRQAQATVYLGQGRPPRVFRGKITFVSPTIQAGGDYRVRAEFDNVQENGNWLLQAGQRAQLKIIN